MIFMIFLKHIWNHPITSAGGVISAIAAIATQMHDATTAGDVVKVLLVSGMPLILGLIAKDPK